MVQGHVKSKKSSAVLRRHRTAGHRARAARFAWKFGGFPLDQVKIRGKTGSAEVYGKQCTSWVATYTKDYVVVMMVTQGGTGSGTSGPFVRKIWEALYGIPVTVDAGHSVIPGVPRPTPAAGVHLRRLDPAPVVGGSR